MQQGFRVILMGRTADDGADTDLLEGAGSAILPETAFPQFSQDVFRDSAVVDGHKFIAAEPGQNVIASCPGVEKVSEFFSKDGHRGCVQAFHLPVLNYQYRIKRLPWGHLLFS